MVGVLKEVRRAMAHTVGSGDSAGTTAQVAASTADAVGSLTREALRTGGAAVGVRSARAQVADAVADVAGAGAELRLLWADPAVTDVLVNGPREVWVDRGSGLERAAVVIGDVRALAVRLAAAAGQRLDDAAPIVDGRLPDGTRLHAVLHPVAARHPCISLRRHAPRALSLATWRATGGLPGPLEQVLRALVASRANLLISGGTGSGKTTLLATLLAEVSPSERIVCIEEARELAPDHPHVVHLQAKAANVQGAGEISLASLVRAAMRMRPDRLVLGECRGAEVREVLLALNTGHDGGMATVHANTALDVPARLIALGSLAGMAPESVALQAVSAFDAVVHVVRRGGRRSVDHIAVLRRADGQLGAELALHRQAGAGAGAGEVVVGGAWDHLARRLERGG